MIIQTFAPEYYICFKHGYNKNNSRPFRFRRSGDGYRNAVFYLLAQSRCRLSGYGRFGEPHKRPDNDLHLRYLFAGKTKEQQEITAALNHFEQDMAYDYIPGVLDFIADLRRNHVKMAVVTSSNDRKMAAVYRARPEVETMFDRILTAEMFAHSKPAPDCFLLGMEVFGTTPATTYVFEDSFNGLKAGMASEATVIGLATTNSREAIAPLCHCVLDDFTGFTYDKMLQVHK